MSAQRQDRFARRRLLWASVDEIREVLPDEQLLLLGLAGMSVALTGEQIGLIAADPAAAAMLTSYERAVAVGADVSGDVGRIAELLAEFLAAV